MSAPGDPTASRRRRAQDRRRRRAAAARLPRRRAAGHRRAGLRVPARDLARVAGRRGRGRAAHRRDRHQRHRRHHGRRFVRARPELHHHPHHRRRARRVSGRARPLPAGRGAGLPVGQPRDHRPPAARVSKPVLSMGICGPTHDERSWTFDLDPGGVDPVLGIERIQQAYFARFPGYDRGITVPAIVDVPTGQVVTNDFAQMTLDLSLEWTAFHRPGAPELYPEKHRDEIDEVAELVFRDVNNGVYRCGFAGSQEAYDDGVRAAVRPAGLAGASGWPASASSSATRSPRPTCGCSRRSPASTPSTTTTSSATGASWPRCRCCGPTPATCSRRRASATRPTSSRSSSTTTACTAT